MFALTITWVVPDGGVGKPARWRRMLDDNFISSREARP